MPLGRSVANANAAWIQAVTMGEGSRQRLEAEGHCMPGRKEAWKGGGPLWSGLLPQTFPLQEAKTSYEKSLAS